MPTGRVLSLNVGTPAPFPWRGRQVMTAIGKEPVDGPLPLTAEGFAGDVQADRRVHGGPDKAVCCYASEHLPQWEELLGHPLPRGAFGENLTLSGMLETEVHVGDVFTVGTATVQVSQPRGPCFKLTARWGRRKLPALMAKQGISGWYFRILEGGEVRPGDAVTPVARGSDVSIADVMRVTYSDRDDDELLDRVLAVPELAAAWREPIAKHRAELPIRDFGT